MPSPFPGMDPYLEDPAFWEDFHDGFITYWRDALNDRLPGSYEARIKERVTIVDEAAGWGKQFIPDVAVLGDRPGEGAGRPGGGGGGGVATLEPVTVPLILLDRTRTTYIEIRRIADRGVVSVLELLSPANKSGADRRIYLEKREALLQEEIHLFELDLLLSGRRLPVVDPYPPGDYFALLSHAARREVCDVYAWSLRQPLPTLPIPLRPPDPDVLIDFQALFTTAYDRGRYVRSLSYDRPPPTPLPDADREWARGLLDAAARHRAP